MKILIVHNLLWAHYKAKVFQEVDRLARTYPDVEVKVLQIARNEKSRKGLETSDPDTPVYHYRYELLFDAFIEDTTVKQRTKALLQHIRSYQPDVLNLTGYYDPAQLALLLYAKLTGIKVIMQNESTAADHTRGGLKERLKKAIFRLCDGFFCFGTLSADYLTSSGVKPSQILLKKNAVDNDALLEAWTRARQTRTGQQQALGLKPHNFIFVGRLIEVKNLIRLVEAFASVRQTNPDWGLILLGEGPMSGAIQQRARELNVADAVTSLPGRAWYKVPDILALADVLVLPSLSEPWGLVVNEAMVCGMPVIVSDRCGCVVDLVRDQQNGFVIDPGQTPQLAGVMHRFMTGEVDQAAMGAVAQEMIRPYSAGAVAREMLEGFLTIHRTRR
ncbi:glycosyltransferase family 4 protein [Arsenicibacter rosenii]|uniref:Glycosyl transferase family 1 n=1 Tax=Arsenicibacter rosenii TaxID=1750698 RepID=A0A1S2VPS3_9BACT|nr:glycosyltransferase family 4 protein [Arsenicibacter rosenii]OIN60773.1 glycosyl transferase family 1 [Arsenicibacter rosenii]